MMGIGKEDKKNEVAVTISTGTFVRLALLTVTTVLLLLAIQKASHAILLIFTAFFLALALNAPVHWVQLPGKRRGSRTLATSISFVIVVLVLIGFIASVAPPLVKQTQSFIKIAPNLVQDFRDEDSQYGQIVQRYHLEKQVNNISSQLSDRLKNAGGTAFSTVQKIGSSFFSLVTILVLTFMMLIEGPRWLRFFEQFVPSPDRPKARSLVSEMNRVVKGYVNGQVLLAALAAVIITPVIMILGISYPIALMVIVFICGLIPMVGHTLGAIIVTAVALFHSLPAALIILAFYILYQQIENAFI
jgi:predicted PurR-regulated permease PerM